MPLPDDLATCHALLNDLLREYPERPLLLDQFAQAAMQSLLGSDKWWTNTNGDNDETLDVYFARTADAAYDAAQAMLAERARRLDMGE